jgi:spore germination cell wall hydrolase CwlJ-like protein
MSSVESALAKTIYNESRGEGKEGMDAIASTIKNRYEVNRPSLGG